MSKLDDELEEDLAKFEFKKKIMRYKVNKNPSYRDSLNSNEKNKMRINLKDYSKPSFKNLETSQQVHTDYKNMSLNLTESNGHTNIMEDLEKLNES